jgi:lipopolysaccharide/colanic/teichoic acid biosynthesis glycosyltransferase
MTDLKLTEYENRKKSCRKFDVLIENQQFLDEIIRIYYNNDYVKKKDYYKNTHETNQKNVFKKILSSLISFVGVLIIILFFHVVIIIIYPYYLV